MGGPARAQAPHVLHFCNSCFFITVPGPGNQDKGAGTVAQVPRNLVRGKCDFVAIKEAEKTPEGKKVKQLELYKASAINQVFETGLPSELPKTLEAIFKPLGIIWNKKEALQIENK
jgi:hypothetical protein